VTTQHAHEYLAPYRSQVHRQMRSMPNNETPPATGPRVFSKQRG
jgi:hypothetical protein